LYSENYTIVWRWPQFAGLCKHYELRKNQRETVADSNSWKQIKDGRLDYMLEQDHEAETRDLR
jgi:hypothetical protein